MIQNNCSDLWQSLPEKGLNFEILLFKLSYDKQLNADYQ
jgi:hypothetical protein